MPAVAMTFLSGYDLQMIVTDDLCAYQLYAPPPPVGAVPGPWGIPGDLIMKVVQRVGHLIT